MYMLGGDWDDSSDLAGRCFNGTYVRILQRLERNYSPARSARQAWLALQTYFAIHAPLDTTARLRLHTPYLARQVPICRSLALTVSVTAS